MRKLIIFCTVIPLLLLPLVAATGCQQQPAPAPPPTPTPPPAPTPAPSPVPPAQFEITSLDIKPREVMAGETQQLEVIAIDQHGNRLSEFDTVWKVTDENAGSITETGLFTAGEVAKTFHQAIQVKVTRGDLIRTAVAPVTILPSPLVQVVIAPKSAEIGVKITQQFVVVGADWYGNRISNLAFSWSVENGVGTIDETGLLTAGTTPGTYRDTVKVEATQGGFTSSATASVIVEPDRIMFIADRGGEPRGIYIMDDDGTNIIHVTGLPASCLQTRITTYGAARCTFSSSPDGRHIMLSHKHGIMKINADGSGLVSLIENDSEITNSDPDWSPDGSKIVFIKTTENDSSIYVMDADGGNVTQLTDTSISNSDPDWSPDGSKIVFSKTTENDSGIYVMDADGGNVTQLLDKSAGALVWSPNGNQILFYSGEGISVIEPDGSGRKRLSYHALSPNWSPDGSKIVFSKTTESNSDIYVMDADGTKERQLTSAMGSPTFLEPAWSPGGSKIIFVSRHYKLKPVSYGGTEPGFYTIREHERDDIYVMDADGRNKILLTDYWDETSHYPVWLPRKRGVEVTEDSVVIPGPVP